MRFRGSPRYCKEDEPPGTKIVPVATGRPGRQGGEDDSEPGDLPASSVVPCLSEGKTACFLCLSIPAGKWVVPVWYASASVARVASGATAIVPRH